MKKTSFFTVAMAVLTIAVCATGCKTKTAYITAENDQVVENGGYTLENYYRLEGSGADLKLGVIVRPFEESPFRLGLSVHTPTWFELTESYNATLSSDILAYESPYSQTLSDHLSSDYLTYDYKMITPWKFNVSAGTTFGGVLALGAEYEYSDYASTKLEDVDGFELGGQASVEDALEAVHTFRAGMEARIASQFSFRAGYNYTSAAFKDDAYSALDVYRTHTDFNNVKSKNTVTFGLGYRGNTIYADMAYKCDMYKSDFYAFDDVDLPKTVVDNARHQLVFTLGARF
jgi:long-subunit fatty acid transport protein